jgi:hypothetical protein
MCGSRGRWPWTLGVTVRELAQDLQVMKRLRASIPTGYQPATAHAIRARSFGRLKAPRNLHATTWQERSGTLDDQAIFGPLQDFLCACGKYRDAKHQNMICDRCGVKATTRSVRRLRFGHIELAGAIDHPFGESQTSLDVFPVLPAAFRESVGAKDLIQVYDHLAGSSVSGSATTITESIIQLVELLWPVFSVANTWGLQEADMIAFGMGLESTNAPDPDTCNHCGYPLQGLKVVLCPGCGNPRL